MGLRSFFRKQLSIVIEWKNQQPNFLFYKIQTPTSEIKNASKLIISPGQGCILVYEGKVQDVLTEPGTYFIESDNHPFITNLLKLRQSFESEHKMHLYFFRTAEVVNQSWGTPSPIKYVDPKYQFPIQLGAYGNYSVKIADGETIFTNIIGAKDLFTTEDLREIITGRIQASLTSTFAKSAYSYNEIDAHLQDMSAQVKININDTISNLGLLLTDFQIESSSFDESTQAHINKIASMTAEALAAAEVGLDYVQLEKLRALRDAARNEGGLAGAGLQVGAGLELSKSLLQQKDEILKDSSDNDDLVQQLKKLKTLLDEQIITQDEFDNKKREILSRI